MKNLFNTVALLLVCCFLSYDLHSQRAILPNIGSIYNFAQGDSFLYKLTDLNTNKVTMYVNRVVLSRDDSHYPDSLIYNIQEIFLDTNGLNPSVWDTVRKVYRHCNDTIFPYNGFISCQEGTDSCGVNGAISITTDSLFPGLTIYHALFDCGWWNSGWNNAAEELGIVHAYNACGDFVLQQYDIVLVHYYKATTGSTLLSNEAITFEISPNPVSNSVTIKVDGSMIGSTATIYDISGRKMLVSKIETKNQKLETTNLTNGVYFVTVSSVSRNATRKLIINNQCPK